MTICLTFQSRRTPKTSFWLALGELGGILELRWGPPDLAMSILATQGQRFESQASLGQNGTSFSKGAFTRQVEGSWVLLAKVENTGVKPLFSDILYCMLGELTYG